MSLPSQSCVEVMYKFLSYTLVPLGFAWLNLHVLRLAWHVNSQNARKLNAQAVTVCTVRTSMRRAELRAAVTCFARDVPRRSAGTVTYNLMALAFFTTK